MARPEDESPKQPDPHETSPLPNADEAERQTSETDETTPWPRSGDSTPPAVEGQEKLNPEEVPTTPLPPRSEILPSFSPGQLVAGRYQLVRFIGQGGMGEVYEAEDLELGQRVALKTLRPEIAQDQQALERFKREIRMAREVTHANVCRIFDLEYHRKATGGEATFLTMELLAGETLAERLRRTGRVTPAEALPLVRQMAAALDAAHKAGIIHRDFKSSNVVLVPGKVEDALGLARDRTEAPDQARKREPGGLPYRGMTQGEKEVRAVVTDFGLARRVAPSDSLGRSLSGTGDILGTPAYMAPEQVEAREITPATDIYALGVVMYEMVTGTWPFAGDTPIATAIKRLEERPPSPRTHVPDLDRSWDVAILRCLERDPANRFASAADVVKALGGEAVAPGRRQEQRRLALAGAAVVILLALAFAVGYHLRVRKGGAAAGGTAPAISLPAGPIKLRRSIAVLGFKNLSARPEAAWLSIALSEMLTTELAAGEKLRTVPGENIARMKTELSLADADSFATDTLHRIRMNLGADFVVLGSYLALGKESGGQIRLDLRVQDATVGETIVAVAETGTEVKLLDLVSSTGAHLRQKLGAGELSPTEMAGMMAAMPSNPEGARLYAEGLAKLRVFDALTARDLLAKAVAADSDYALAHSAWAAAWSALGYDAKAKEEARKALDLSANLSREERLLVEGRYREMAKEWGKAIEIYRTLFDFFPDNLDYGLVLAAAQTEAGKGKDALASVEALRKLPSPARDDPRIDLAEAKAAGSLSDFKREQAVAARAAAKAEAAGARLLLAQAQLRQGSSLDDLSQFDQARALTEEAKRTFEGAGDQRGVADAIRHIADVLSDQGNLTEAKKMYEEALATYRRIGNQSGMANALYEIANVLSNQGSAAEAKRKHEQALAIFREIEDQRGVAMALSEIGTVLSSQGNLTGAGKMFEESLAAYRQFGDQQGVAITLWKMAEMRSDQGDLTAAKQFAEESLAIARKLGYRAGAADALFDLGDILQEQGDLVGARQRYEEALGVSREAGMKDSEAEDRVALADLAVEEGRPAEGEAPAREAAEEFRKENMRDDEASACAVLARSLLVQGKFGEAQDAIDRARSLGRESRSTRLDVAITSARIRGASGNSGEARKMLQSAIAEASQAGLVPSQFEARLALGEIEMKSGNSAAGRARLEALAREAREKRFGLVARKAEAARK